MEEKEEEMLPKKYRLILITGLGLLLLFLALFLSRGQEGHSVLSGKVFGSYYRVVTREDCRALQPEMDQLFRAINEEMSVFCPNSLINQINEAPAGTCFDLSPALYQLLIECQRVYRLSEGAYDPTVEPLVDLWGFGKKHEQQDVSPESVAEVLSRVGFDGLELQGGCLIKKREGLALDLSSVAKGYAVDELARLFDRHGYKDYLIDIGGELKAKGSRSKSGDAWLVGIQAPDEQGVVSLISLPLREMAVATSGDYRRVLNDKDGAYSHMISPQTGYPVRGDFASVSVFHPSAMMADIYATALMLMPREAAVALAESQKLPVILIRLQD